MRSPRDSRPRAPRSLPSKVESRAARRRRVISEIHEASNTAALSVEAGGDTHVAHEQFLRRVDEVTTGLGAEDELAVARCVMRDNAIEARAARVATEEYARKRLAELAAEWTWLMQVFTCSTDGRVLPEDRAVLMSLMQFLDRHGISNLVESWDTPSELIAFKLGADGNQRLHLLAPKLVDAASQERAYQRLRREGVDTTLGRIEPDVAHPVVARSMGETEGAHRSRTRRKKALRRR